MTASERIRAARESRRFTVAPTSDGSFVYDAERHEHLGRGHRHESAAQALADSFNAETPSEPHLELLRRAYLSSLHAS